MKKTKYQNRIQNLYETRSGICRFCTLRIIFFLKNLLQVNLFDHVPRSKISIIDKPGAHAFEVVAERVE